MSDELKVLDHRDRVLGLLVESIQAARRMLQNAGTARGAPLDAKSLLGEADMTLGVYEERMSKLYLKNAEELEAAGGTPR